MASERVGFGPDYRGVSPGLPRCPDVGRVTTLSARRSGHRRYPDAGRVTTLSACRSGHRRCPGLGPLTATVVLSPHQRNCLTAEPLSVFVRRAATRNSEHCLADRVASLLANAHRFAYSQNTCAGRPNRRSIH